MRILIFEFWGLGDAVMATSVIRRCLENGHDVTVLSTGGSKALLQRTYPDLEYHVFDLPWKGFTGKYKLWKWNWIHLFQLVRFLFSRKDDAVISVRPDPRDHFLMSWSRCKQRIGVKRGNSGFRLTNAISQSAAHRVEDWNSLYDLVENNASSEEMFCSPSLLRAEEKEGRKLVFHVGARIAVRRLDLKVYKKLILDAKKLGWEVHVMADPDGYGAELQKVADHFYDNISLDELQEIYEKMSGFIGNDSAPAHIASAMGLPTLAFFGPTSAEWFRPWGGEVTVVQQQVCPFKPCFDYCRLESAICMDVLSYDRVKPDFDTFLTSI